MKKKPGKRLTRRKFQITIVFFIILSGDSRRSSMVITKRPDCVLMVDSKKKELGVLMRLFHTTVTHLEVIRIILSIVALARGCYIELGDVSNAFLNPKVNKDVYMSTPPEGFESQGRESPQTKEEPLWIETSSETVE